MASTWRKRRRPRKSRKASTSSPEPPSSSPTTSSSTSSTPREKKVHPGDHLKLINHDWRVAGIYESGKLAAIMAPIDTLQQLTGNEGKISAVYLKLDDPAKADAFVKNLRLEMNGGNSDPEAGYQIYTVEEFTSQLNVNSVTMLKDFIYVVIGIASIVGFIVVFMAMYTAVLERTREIGILKAVGAGPGYILTHPLPRDHPARRHRHPLRHRPDLRHPVAHAHAVPASLVQETVYKWWPIAAAIAIVGASRRHHRPRRPRRQAGRHRGPQL